jgi:ApaG protein
LKIISKLKKIPAMVTKITDGVKVTVETLYQPEYSNPVNEHFMFAYKVHIENLSEYSVQLLRRHWYIFDSNGTHREVEGEGVVGQQPVIEPGESHEYVSGCNLKTDIGTMKGLYYMRRIVDNDEFKVNIPEFYLIAPYKLN